MVSAIGWTDAAEKQRWDDLDVKAKALAAKCAERIAEGEKVEAARHLIEQIGAIIQGLELLVLGLAPDPASVRLTLRAIENSLLILDNTLQQL